MKKQIYLLGLVLPNKRNKFSLNGYNKEHKNNNFNTIVMKNSIKKSCLLIAVLILTANLSHAQLNGFELTPSGTTESYMNYIRKAVTIDETGYLTGYLALTTFKNFNTNTIFNDITPFQKLQIQGGNILLCHSNSPSSVADINPTSRNGAILFSDWASVSENNKHGKWGIEYDNQYSTGGLNFFKPVSQLTSNRINFSFFISNSGNIGVGSGDPVAKFQVKDGDIFIEDINRGIIMKSPDGRCWRGVLNNFGQLEFTEIQDCIITSSDAQTFQPGSGVSINPNPVTDQLEVNCRQIGAVARLITLSGTELSSYPLQQGTTFIPVFDLKPGMYMLNIVIQGKGVVETHKFVKQ